MNKLKISIIIANIIMDNSGSSIRYPLNIKMLKRVNFTFKRNIFILVVFFIGYLYTL